MVSRIPSEPTRRIVLGAGLAVLSAGRGFAEPSLTVLAAASLKPALDEIVASWDGPVGVSYGGSGVLARQAAVGAPADLILLAATDWMDWLARQDVLTGAPVPVATNRLVLAGAAGALPLDLTAQAIDARLGQSGRFAMGDPMSVPAGRYGQQALETLGLWSGLRHRAILAENVRAALAYIARGDVTLGLVYGSDLAAGEAQEVAAIPARTHQPIVYPGAVLRGAAPQAEAFLANIASSSNTFARHGFRA